jgi:hypothetical protein
MEPEHIIDETATIQGADIEKCMMAVIIRLRIGGIHPCSFYRVQ